MAYEYTIFQQKKARIAQKAVSLLEPNDVVAIDSGSTMEHFSQNLPTDMHLTVLTYSMNTLRQLSERPNCDVICCGGYLYPNTQMFYSSEGISLIKRTCINKAFIAAAGISGKQNVTCIAPHEVRQDLPHRLRASEGFQYRDLRHRPFSRMAGDHHRQRHHALCGLMPAARTTARGFW